ncbi:hypothetical protein [Saccharicrinis sp. GN24d3]|uniref:hypothetical protein n=1 Tax=Saccharicrinis sp. GN24d3 TaxID=3458416 RepID=UPI004035CC24
MIILEIVLKILPTTWAGQNLFGFGMIKLGLNEITYLQFSLGIVACLTLYYMLLLAYLAIKNKSKVQENSFEEEADRPMVEIKVKELSSNDYPMERVCLTENAWESFIVKPDEAPDPSGISIDNFQRPCKMENREFEKELAYATRQPALS